MIADALCYSATDIFAAGFQDNNIGAILGTNRTTGAGGANVWEYYNLFHPLGFSPLPRNAQMRMAVKRAIRVGNQNGFSLEDSGVIPDYIHNMTFNDVLNGNVDLIEKSCEYFGDYERIASFTFGSLLGWKLEVARCIKCTTVY